MTKLLIYTPETHIEIKTLIIGVVCLSRVQTFYYSQDKEGQLFTGCDPLVWLNFALAHAPTELKSLRDTDVNVTETK